MIENLDRTIDRSEKIEVTKMRSDSLVQTSVIYVDKTRRVRREMRKRRIIYTLISIGCFLLLVLIILFWACGITFDKCTSD